MRMLIWIVGLLALATSLDSSLYGGAYTRAFVAMIQDMHKAFGLKFARLAVDGSEASLIRGLGGRHCLPIRLCEQAHSERTGPAIRFESLRGRPGMAGKIFINYRRDDLIGMAGRLHDRLVQTFGRDKLFMDVDHIPAGADFVAHLNNQVAECDVVLAIIGPNWLRAKDKAGQRRLHQPDDFVAIEIAAALARDTLVIPVLVDAARMPKESDLPDTLKPLARRQAVEVRHAHFGHDAEALIARMRKALGQEAAGPGRWSVPLVAVAAATLLLLVGWGGYAFIQKREGV